jgi:hypothetical protein
VLFLAALGVLVFVAREGVKKLFLKSAGFVVGGVKDDVGVVAVASVVVLLLVWGAIIARSLYEARAEAAARRRHGEP